jgi:hypothetical protein
MVRTIRRKPAQNKVKKVSIKLHVHPDDEAWVRTVAEARRWSRPLVICACIEIVRKNGLL